MLTGCSVSVSSGSAILQLIGWAASLLVALSLLGCQLACRAASLLIARSTVQCESVLPSAAGAPHVSLCLKKTIGSAVGP